MNHKEQAKYFADMFNERDIDNLEIDDVQSMTKRVCGRSWNDSASL